jgi:O-antigen ligase
MFKDHPLTGVADSHIKEIYETYKKAEQYGEGVHLHNNFIMILATTGIFGFLSFLGIFVLIFVKQIRYYRESKSEINKLLIFGSILVMISFQISGIFEWSFGDHEVMTVFFFLISVPFVLEKQLAVAVSG